MNKPLIISGIVLLSVGVLAGIFTTTQTSFFGSVVTQTIPYAAYAVPLFIAGVILATIGLIDTKKRRR